MDHIKFSKNTEWLKPFVARSAKLVPLEKLRKIHGYHIAKGLEELQDGAITKYSGKFSISIRMKNTPQTQGEKYTNVYYQNLLDTLAHELAHLVHWEHTAEHMELQARIMVRFSKILGKVGITDTYARWSNKIVRNKAHK